MGQRRIINGVKRESKDCYGFSKEGISFRDITTLLKDPEAYVYTVDSLVNYCREKGVDIIVG